MKWEKGQTPEGAKPFSKGQSGNPQGRPAGTENSRTRLKRILTAEIEAVNDLTGQKEILSGIDLMDIAMIKKALDGNVSAYAEILDRFEGKPTHHQTTEHKSISIQWTEPKAN